ncbi:hypothetical protein [Klebsiella variicola]|uniref:hypothetical protein n=1 Tax=Klebsiella variicola TaxID=244366 RepID=UPI00109D6805|nr:hypothetical protein [Klebsiella variicola]VGQ07259.1 hypothetical protein SB5544_04434 [Klebsiella variicola]
MTKSTITREQLEEWVAQFDEDGGCDATDRQLEALIRQSLAAMDSDPVAWTDEEELRDVNVAGIGYLFGIDREANKFADPRRQIMLYRHAQPAPVVMDDEKLRALFDAWFASDCSFDQSPEASEADNIAWRESYWYVWQRCRGAMLQASNCRDNANSSTNNFREIPETSTNSSREHFISLCNEFWNWSEMDVVCAEDRGYELRMEWDGKVFKHPVTQALWRMYQAAPQEVHDEK